MPTIQGKLVGDVFTPDSILKKKIKKNFTVTVKFLPLSLLNFP